ncbi:TonB-dependent hemoglobin/transferrin/lactoferrin family receptor [Pusillimonas sp. ANT_WB101]|uniref:TonB-dependent hemoglobin/transferrin/lactoferrin family receptor n=1 Tax=Pusillimonas sp. ANT_WB101 TaxID=2597356 RepID=UPI0011EDE408|nr:TonB-dependent hemoglobin/transferrin/lactoferrin family receptor [Pusillimonas sp. ANT_WB101]KAA0888510.1 TonB-dependent hemoglobin/transferrin/lactoferrin family receptor [Pusillimonas sp. ANT_WB101]
MAHPRLSPTRSSLALLALAGTPLLAVAADKSKSIQTLSTVTVQGEATQGDDVTGLGKTQKTHEDLAHDQVVGIRDLLRYDPGIAVNESGGRGTSSGFSMRGVDRDRVAVTVDGMAQAQTFQRQGFGRLGAGQGRSSGAQNEVEFENLKSVELSQGSSSVLAGSGALGGAVIMQTKEVDDFIHGARNWGITSKTTYTEKDGRTAQTLGAGGRSGPFEGLIQHTLRRGHEIRSHKDIYRHGGGEIQRYRLDGNGQMSEALSAKDISGPDRKVPNPMKYKSDSWLSRAGYHVAPGHYAGLIVEQTVQHYDIRDMFGRNYWSNMEQDSIYRPSGNLAEFQYTPTRYYRDQHTYRRLGAEYRFVPHDAQGWADDLHLRVDKQHIRLNSAARSLNCSPYPLADPNCASTLGKTGSRTHHLSTNYTQTLTRIDVVSNKSFQLARSHTLRLNAGVDHSKTRISDHDISQHAYSELDAADGVIKQHFSSYTQQYHSSPIKGRHFYLAFHDTVELGNRWTLGLGGRYDHHVFSAAHNIFDTTQSSTIWSGKTGLQNKPYANYSWDLGLVYKLSNTIDLAYKASSGFRVPTAGEMLGPSFNRRGERLPQPWLKAEKSHTHEFGIHADSRYGTASASYFFADYKHLIDTGLPKPELGYPEGHIMYYNLQSVKTKGFTLKTQLDLHQLWQKMPDGLQAMLALSHVRQDGVSPRNPNFQSASSYALDMLQPLRLVYGLEYIAPDEGWGVAIKTTYSGPKKPAELTQESVTGGMKYIGDRKTAILTPKWLVTDVSGHYRFNNYVTLRIGVYNLFNYRYVTWESARQATFEPIGNSVLGSNYLALAAPGRNYTLNLEIKY